MTTLTDRIRALMERREVTVADAVDAINRTDYIHGRTHVYIERSPYGFKRTTDHKEQA